VAEDAGFEPARSYKPQPAFQASAIGH